MTCEGWIGSDWHANVHHRLVGEFRLTIERIGDGWTWAVSVRVVGGTGRYNLAVADHYEDTMERAAEVCEIAARRRGIMVPPSTDEAIAGRAREAALKAEVERLTADRASARADAATCRQVATEAIDDLSHGVDCDRRRDDDGVVRGCDCYIATLRARLASPKPARLRCLVDDLVDSSGPLVGIEYCEDPESERTDREQRHATARALLLAALGAKED